MIRSQNIDSIDAESNHSASNDWGVKHPFTHEREKTPIHTWERTTCLTHERYWSEIKTWTDGWEQNTQITKLSQRSPNYTFSNQQYEIYICIYIAVNVQGDVSVN